MKEVIKALKDKVVILQSHLIKNSNSQYHLYGSVFTLGTIVEKIAIEGAIHLLQTNIHTFEDKGDTLDLEGIALTYVRRYINLKTNYRLDQSPSHMTEKYIEIEQAKIVARFYEKYLSKEAAAALALLKIEIR